MDAIPTERAWIRICRDLGFQPKDVKGLRKIYRRFYPPIAAGPPFGVRYRGLVIKGRRFETAIEAAQWGFENYKGRMDWEVISLARPVPNGEADV